MKLWGRRPPLTNAEKEAQQWNAYAARSRALGEARGGSWHRFVGGVLWPERRLVAAGRAAFRAFLGREERRVISSLPWETGGSLSDTSNIESALSLVPVYSATSYIADTLATLPLQAFRKLGESREEIPTPALFTSMGLQGGQPGQPCDWIHRCVVSLLLRGNAFGLITSRDHNQYPTDIVWLHPDRVSCEDRNTSGLGSYTNPIWRVDGQVVPTEALLHIPAYTVPGRVLGLSPIQQFADTVGVGLHAQKYGLRWFANGGVPPGVLHNTDYELDKEETDEAIALTVARIRSGKPLAFGKDWEYTPLTVTPSDAAFIESTSMTATQVAAIYHIHPEWIGGSSGDSMTYANVEQRMIDFAMITVRPWAYRLESAFYQLIPRPQYVRFNLDALIRADTTTRYQAYQIARNIGLRSIDELRALENLKPLPKGGDDYTPLTIMQKAGAAGGQPAPGESQPPPAPGLKPKVKKPGSPPLKAVK